MRTVSQTSIRRIAGSFLLVLPLLVVACGENPSAPLPPDPGHESVSEQDLSFSEPVTACLQGARERLQVEQHRHRMVVTACNGDPECLRVEQRLHEDLAVEIRREYLRCRQIGR